MDDKIFTEPSLTYKKMPRSVGGQYVRSISGRGYPRIYINDMYRHDIHRTDSIVRHELKHHAVEKWVQQRFPRFMWPVAWFGHLYIDMTDTGGQRIGLIERIIPHLVPFQIKKEENMARIIVKPSSVALYALFGIFGLIILLVILI